MGCKSASKIWCYFSHVQDSQVPESKGRMRVAPITTTPGDSLARILLSIPIIYSYHALLVQRSWFQREECFHQEAPCFQLEGQIVTCPLRLLLPLNQQGKKGVTIVTRVIDPDYQREIDLPLHSRNKKEYVWNTGDSLGCLLTLHVEILIVQVFGMKIWITHQRTMTS